MLPFHHTRRRLATTTRGTGAGGALGTRSARIIAYSRKAIPCTEPPERPAVSILRHMSTVDAAPPATCGPSTVIVVGQGPSAAPLWSVVAVREVSPEEVGETQFMGEHRGSCVYT